VTPRARAYLGRTVSPTRACVCFSTQLGPILGGAKALILVGKYTVCRGPDRRRSGPHPERIQHVISLSYVASAQDPDWVPFHGRPFPKGIVRDRYLLLQQFAASGRIGEVYSRSPEWPLPTQRSAYSATPSMAAYGPSGSSGTGRVDDGFGSSPSVQISPRNGQCPPNPARPHLAVIGQSAPGHDHPRVRAGGGIKQGPSLAGPRVRIPFLQWRVRRELARL